MAAFCGIVNYKVNAQDPPASNWSSEVVYQGISRPTSLGFTPDSKWMFIVSKDSGEIVAQNLKDGYTQGSPVTVLQMYNDDYSETGMYSVAVDPLFDNNHFIYVCYTGGYYTFEVDRLHLIEVEGEIHADSRRVIFGPIPAHQAHNGGILKFGPDGLLYLTVGEHDQLESQDITNSGGKVLRMDRDGIPAPGNPFFGQGGDSSLVYAYGFRNSFGMAFDPAGGDLWLSDVGPEPPEYDEVNIVKAGLNYGWQYGASGGLTGPQYLPELADPAWWANDFGKIEPNGSTEMPTPAGLEFVHSWRYPSDVLGDVFVWWLGDDELHQMRRGGSALQNVDYVADVGGPGVLTPGLGIELAPDGYLYYTSFFSPIGFVNRIKYNDPTIPPVQAAPRGNFGPGGNIRFYCSAEPQFAPEGSTLPFRDRMFLFIGGLLQPPLDTPYGQLLVDPSVGAWGSVDTYGVVTMDVAIPDDPALHGLTFYAQPFHFYGPQGGETSVPGPAVPFTIQ
ncbi:MAG: PQQ-dependent sugar dehydrogenase [Planctomycetes bacterium]|nr:PQQ-dependent sugar dehydrogenase [Planctomycetota bacterium]